LCLKGGRGVKWLSEPAPGWVTLASSTVATLVAILSFVVALKAYRKGDPIVRLTVRVVPDKESGKAHRYLLHIRLNNSGRLEAQIMRIRVSSVLGVFELLDEDVHRGKLRLEMWLQKQGELEAWYRLERGLGAIMQSYADQGMTRRLASQLGHMWRGVRRTRFWIPLWGPTAAMRSGLDLVEVDLGGKDQVSRSSLWLTIRTQQQLRQQLSEAGAE
jgi:hypothetical protein